MSNVLDLKEPPAESPSATDQLEVEPVTQDQASFIAWQADHGVSDSGRRKRLLLLVGIAVAGTIISLWSTSWTTFMVVVVGLAVWELRNRLLTSSQVSIDDEGITVDERHYPHAEFTSFDVHGMPDGTTELSLRTNHWHSPSIRLPIAEHDPEDVKVLLSGYIPYERHPISLLDYWLRK